MTATGGTSLGSLELICRTRAPTANSNHGEESSSISGSGFVLLKKFTSKCEHCGLLGLKDSPWREKCSQSAGDNPSKLHTVPGTSEPGEGGLQTRKLWLSELGFYTHHTYQPSGMWLKAPQAIVFGFFKVNFWSTQLTLLAYRSSWAGKDNTLLEYLNSSFQVNL